jgi:hypothetical protein
LVGSSGAPIVAAVRQTVEGTNGRFTDRCLSENELEQYGCESQVLCGPNMTDCAPYPTGQVISGVYECTTPCFDGACD